MQSKIATMQLINGFLAELPRGGRFVLAPGFVP